MAEIRSKSLDEPDSTLEFPRLTVKQVELGDIPVGLVVVEPGWRWSDDVRPQVDGEWCEARHVGVVVSGRFGATMRDGTTVEFGPNDVFEIPPGHDGFAVGDEPCVNIEWAGLRAFAGFGVLGAQARALATLLFTDIVESTALAARMGDGTWRDLLSTHFEAARGAADQHSGREVNTTGDGLLATFDGPAAALRCAAEIRRLARRQGIAIRASVHVGEVELVGNDVRGIAVHEAARIMSEAGPDEILVSETTRALALSSGLRFESRGMHALKGLPGQWSLYSFVEA
jgi:class 3 adenylate cyclase